MKKVDITNAEYLDVYKEFRRIDAETANSGRWTSDVWVEARSALERAEEKIYADK